MIAILFALIQAHAGNTDSKALFKAVSAALEKTCKSCELTIASVTCTDGKDKTTCDVIGDAAGKSKTIDGPAAKDLMNALTGFDVELTPGKDGKLTFLSPQQVYCRSDKSCKVKSLKPKSPHG
jgi:hypothetical protein